MARRTADQWDALSSGNRRRWRAAYGGAEEARAAYLSGAHLTKAQRGHRYTPSSPRDALERPWDYARYVGRHQEELQALAREEGKRQYGRGPKGPLVTGRERGAKQQYTWIVGDPLRGDQLNVRDARFSKAFQTSEAANLAARQSGAPAGVVYLVDLGAWIEPGEPGNETGTKRKRRKWRFEMWFSYPETSGVQPKVARNPRRYKFGPRPGTTTEDIGQIEQARRQREEPPVMPRPRPPFRPPEQT